MAGALVASYDREPYKARVSALLADETHALQVEPATP